jgi:hypothetical protein
MRFHILILSVFIILIIVIFISLSGVKALEQKKVTYIDTVIDTVTAHSIDSNSFDILSNNINEIVKEDSIEYNSEIKGLKAVLRKDKFDEFKSYIDLVWKNTTTTIIVNGRVDKIHWRPKNASFIYACDLGDTEGGDFVKCTLNYVILTYKKGNIAIRNKEISSHEPYTGLAWSSNGKYYVYSVYSSLRIKEFDSGKVWATKTIIIDNGKINIIPNTPTQLGFFSWVKNDKQILFLWKSHPFNDMPSGYLVMDVSQFKLK